MPAVKFGSDGGGVRLNGDLCEIWRDGRQLGALFDWKLNGIGGDWNAEAGKIRLVPGFQGGDCEFRFISKSPTRRIEIRGIGHFKQENWVATGRAERHPVDIEGGLLWLQAEKLQ